MLTVVGRTPSTAAAGGAGLQGGHRVRARVPHVQPPRGALADQVAHGRFVQVSEDVGTQATFLHPLFDKKSSNDLTQDSNKKNFKFKVKKKFKNRKRPKNFSFKKFKKKRSY